MMNVAIETLSGEAFEAAIPALASLRIKVFREWPYLYDGDFEYEANYLARFIEADRAFLAVVKDGEAIVGAATAAPLAGETDKFRLPFEEAGYDVSKIFYFAESLLLAKYRGQGIGHRFFDAREAYAGSFDEYTHATFCGVVRPDDHPARPRSYRPLNGFWNKRGYEKLNNIITKFAWKDVGDVDETEKPMQFWMREL